MDKSRTEKSVYIMLSGVILQTITMLFGFISRTFFIKVLGMEYLGINGLFTNVLSILSLAELGFGSAIIYFMYKPLAEKNTEELKLIMNFYKTIYRVIGIVIFFIGLCILPFLGSLIKLSEGVNINVPLIYILFLLDTVFSYLFFAYRSSIITADQKGYIINIINLAFVIVESIAEIVVIVIFKNYIAALICKICIKILRNIVISIISGKIYPFLNEKSNKKLPRDAIKRINQKVYSIFVFRISGRLFGSTDNMIISALLGTIYVGINENYLLIITAVSRILDIIKGAFVGAIGNINAIESNETKYIMFKRLDFFNFWINSCCGVCIFQLVNPFITLWLGDKFLFSKATVFIITINFLITSFLNIVFIYRETMGLFEYGRYTQLIGGIVNVILSLLLAKPLGVFGVFLATTISAISITAFPFPKIVYKYGFNKPHKEYIFRYLIYFGLTIVSCILVNYICLFFREISYLAFVGQMIISLIVPNTLYYIIFRKTDEYKYLKLKAISIISRFSKKLNLNVRLES